MTEELLALPAVHNAFVSEMQTFVSEMQAFVSEMREYIKAADKRFESIEEILHRHTNDIGELKGIGLETKLFNRGVPLIATKLRVRDSQRVRGAETDDNSMEFNSAIYDALDDGSLTEEEYERN